MTLNLASKHRPLFSQSNFFEIDDSEEPQRKRQRTEDSEAIPDSLHFNGTDSENTEEKSNGHDNGYVHLFDNGTSPNSSVHSRNQHVAEDSIPTQYVLYCLSTTLDVIQVVLHSDPNVDRPHSTNSSAARSVSRGTTLSPIIGTFYSPFFCLFECVMSF